MTATSAGNAWAVGTFVNGPVDNTLILHWNGRTWSRLPSPNLLSGANDLLAVAASSPGNAWAVGVYRGDGGLQPLALHCC